MSFKILKVIFVILLLVAIGEGGYYFIVLRIPKKKEMTEAVLVSNNTSPATIPAETESLNKIYEPSIEDLIANSNILKTAKRWGIREGQSFTIILEQKGVVTNVRYVKEKKIEPSFTVADNSGTRLFTLLYNPNVKLYSTLTETKKQIGLADLKTGDKIIIKYEVNLLKPLSHIEEYTVYEK